MHVGCMLGTCGGRYTTHMHQPWPTETRIAKIQKEVQKSTKLYNVSVTYLLKLDIHKLVASSIRS